MPTSIQLLENKLTSEEAQSLGVHDIQVLEASGNTIGDLTHPEHNELHSDWQKWRWTYESGDDFITQYLRKFTTRESDGGYNARKDISYVPAFSKAAVNDVKDSIFQRIADVTREGGSKTYQDSVKGLHGGIDLAGTTMNNFIGTVVLPELLSMGRVGVFVDMPELQGNTLLDQESARPYIYHYKAEDILNWHVNIYNNVIYDTLLLKEKVFEVNAETGLPEELVTRFRYMWMRGGFVLVQFFDADSKPIDRFGNQGIDVIVLDLPFIPFVLFKISDSLMVDIANYQIALLNLASSDMAYTLISNFTFYVEFFDPRVDNLYQRPIGHEKVHAGDDSVKIVQAGEKDDSTAAKSREIEVGTTAGRRIPKGLESPRFINPSSEPLVASMKKQDELKRDIKQLIKLAISNLDPPAMASAESKDFDERSLEAGLSAIGLTLEQGERLIAKYWQTYEDIEGDVSTVKYPQKYSLQSDKEKRDEAEDIGKSAEAVPSITYKRSAMKEVATTLLGSKVSRETLDKIEKEIDEADVFSNPKDLTRDVELGLLDNETASKAKGYPEGTVEKAKIDHADRVARIAESQAKARGVSDLGGTASASRDEKLNIDTENTPSEKTRGKA